MAKDTTSYFEDIKLPTRGKGQPRAFLTEDDFKAAIYDYFQKCSMHNRIPTKAGFCALNGISKETFYKQQDYYTDSFACAEQLFEDGTINSPINQQIALRVLECNYGYEPSNNKGTDTLNIDITDDEIDKRLSKRGYIKLDSPKMEIDEK